MILIVDDHLDTCQVLIRLLQSEGIPSHCVEQASKVIPIIESLRPTLLVLDQLMPDMPGIALLKTIRDCPRLSAIPTIFYSATDEGAEEARELGALDWIVKGRTDWNDLNRRIVKVYRSLATGSGNPRPSVSESR